MKNLLNFLFIGKNDRLGSIAAFAIIALIALGCTCGDKFNTSNDDDNRNTANTSTDPFNKKDDDSSGDKDDSPSADGVPSESEAESMVKSLTTDFATAIDTADFSSIYADSSQDFKSTYTEDQMKSAFKQFIDKKGIVVPILRKATDMDADFSPAPYIRSEKGLEILVLEGKFSTKPVPTRFEYEFVKRGGEWKLLKLVVKLT